MKIIGTNEQEEIWKEMTYGDSHMMVYAGAGTGKTFTIVNGAEHVVGRKCFLAFNKAIATELANQLPDDCEAKTFHSLGLGAIKMVRRDCKIDNKKTYNKTSRPSI